MGGIVLSRFGLWSFDLAVTQLMQETVHEAERGVVGGFQGAMQELMSMIGYVLCILFPKPKDFGTLIIVSFLTVSLAALLCSIHCYRVRGHLLHLDRIWRSR
ncbi:hypothetical protein CBR_g42060 [Chara braunii]|uniref:Solute carrier family 40 member n=1 Tax=Chara braunii TaxID=69332 RepID=A0A388LWX9_CHABU|nr:hypothetical protein CBR_g42060 [Chara braunii]|eukprot:GBG86775.1 hypothetical protein CBR_g42060 [Chara braunii]